MKYQPAANPPAGQGERQRHRSTQSGLHLGQLDAPTRLQLEVAQARNDRQLRVHLRERTRARRGSSGCMTNRPRPVEKRKRQFRPESARGTLTWATGSRSVTRIFSVRGRTRSTETESIAETEFEIALHRRQIQRDEVRHRLYARPAAQFVRQNLAVGLHIDLWMAKSAFS